MSMSAKQIKEILSEEPAVFDQKLAQRYVQNDTQQAICYFMAVTKHHLQELKKKGIEPAQKTPLSHHCHNYLGYFETAYRLHGVDRAALNLGGWQPDYEPNNQETRTFLGILGPLKWTKDSLYTKEFSPYFFAELLETEFAVTYLQTKAKEMAAEAEKLAAEKKELQQEKLILEAEEMTANFAEQCHVLDEKLTNWQQQKSQQNTNPTANPPVAESLAAALENIAKMQQKSAAWHAKNDQRRKTADSAASTSSFKFQ